MEEEATSSSSASTSSRKNALCIICCYQYHPNPPVKGDKSERNNGKDVESEVSNHASEISSSTVKIIRLPNSSQSQKREHFEKFIKLVVGDGRLLEDRGMTLKLAQSICKDCMDIVEQSVASKEKVDKEEVNVTRLQIELLQALRKLNSQVVVFQDNLKDVQRLVNDSEQSGLESRVKDGEIPGNVYEFRDRVGQVLQHWTNIQSTLQSKITVNRSTVNADKSPSVKKEKSSVQNIPKQARSQKKNESSRDNPTHRVQKVIQVLSSHEDNESQVNKSNSGDRHGPLRTASKDNSLQKRKHEEEEEDDDDESKLVIAEDEDDDKSISVIPERPPPMKRKTRNEGRKQKKQSTPLERVSKRVVAPVPEETRRPTRRVVTGVRQSGRNKVSSSTPQVSNPRKKLRGPKTTPAAPGAPEYTDRKLKTAHVKVERLTAARIKQIIDNLKKPKPSAAAASSSKKNTTVTRIVSFGSTSDEDDEDEADDITSSCSSVESDSLVRHVSKIPAIRVSRWKQKVIIALLSKMKFEEKRRAKNGIEPSKYMFDFKKRSNVLQFGGITIVFHETERNLGCSKCGKDYRTSHHENNYFDEITGHMLKYHLGGGGGDSSSSTLTSASKKKRKATGNWDPEWEESEKSEEDEEEEENVGSTTTAGKDDAVMVPELCTRPKRATKVTSRKVLTSDKKDKKKKEVDKEGSEAEEWAPSSSPSGSVSDLDDSDAGEKTTKKKSKKPATASSKQASPVNRKGTSCQKAKSPTRDKTTTPDDGQHQISANKKLLVDMINKWNQGKEAKTAFQLIKKKGLPPAARFSKVICTHNDITGEIKVLGTPIYFREKKEDKSLLECSRCTHVEQVEAEDLEEAKTVPHAFTAHRDIILHVLVSHMNAFDCASCGKRFHTPSQVTMHIKTCEKPQQKNKTKGSEEEWTLAESQKENDKGKNDQDETTDDGSSFVQVQKKISRFTSPAASDDKSGQTKRSTTGTAPRMRLWVHNNQEESEEESSSEDDDGEGLLDIN